MKKIYLLLLLPISPIFIIMARVLQFVKNGNMRDLIKPVSLAISAIFIFILILPFLLSENGIINSKFLETVYLYTASTIISVLVIIATDKKL